jgi:hypothetical protein
MKKIGFLGLVLGFLALGLLPRAASAQANVVTVDIAFAFLVGDTQLPAGKYEIVKVKDWDYRITNLKTHQNVMFTTEATTMSTPAKSFTLYFNVYGNQCYLSKFFHQGKTDGFMIPQTAAEKALAQKGPAEIKTVIRKSP